MNICTDRDATYFYISSQQTFRARTCFRARACKIFIDHDSLLLIPTSQSVCLRSVHQPTSPWDTVFLPKHTLCGAWHNLQGEADVLLHKLMTLL